MPADRLKRVMATIVLLCMSFPMFGGHSVVMGAPPGYDVYDEFNYLDTNLWTLEEFGSPAFTYNVGRWVDQETWIYVESMTGGGTEPSYNGYHFIHRLSTPYTGSFQIGTELYWGATSDYPAFQVSLRLLDAEDNVRIQVQYRDWWSSFVRCKVATIEDDVTEVDGLPLSGRAQIIVTRDESNLVRIYWGGELLKEGTTRAEIAKICLRIVGHYNKQGGSGGFNYLYAQSWSLPPHPSTSTVEVLWLILAFLVVTVVIVAIVVLVLVVRQQDKEAVIKEIPPRYPPPTTMPLHSPTHKQDTAVYFCPHCNAPIQPEDRYCFRCGKRLENLGT